MATILNSFLIIVIMTKPKPTDPLTLDEVKEAADIFFPLFQHIDQRLPMNSTMEDKLRVMESVCSLAQKLRMNKEEKSEGPFGFNKKTEEVEESTDE